MAFEELTAVEIDYTNYKGERSRRLIRPKRLWFGCNAWHKEPQWLLDAFDFTKDEWRTFAMNNIHEWKIPNNEV
jgi:predicted DNA-binding transcriptional regulator YafY